MRATPRPKPKQTAVSFDQLEPSKENIQPLLRSAGKRMHRLAENLQQTPKALTQKQERERRQWETALQRDTSSDPLSLWLKYIKWTKLNFTCPTNQKAQLLPLIERCTRKFKQDSRYTNNKQYIKLWLEYAHLSRDSMEVFKFLQANKIGQQLALFWRGWAIVAEQNNQFDLVDRIFTAAKNINAQPMKDITKSYDAFLLRMKKKISNENIEVMNQLNNENNNNNNMRYTLGQINDSGSHRNNYMKSKGFGQEINSNNKKCNSNGNDKFGVYCDENEENNPNLGKGYDGINLPPVTNGWRDLGSQSERRKENDGIPAPWNNQALGNNNNNVQQQEQSFAIPVDDELQNTNTNNKNRPIPRGNSLVDRKANFSVQDKLFSNPLANYHNPKEANDPLQPLCTHMSRAMGRWTQQGRYLCASFVDPNLLIYNQRECSLEEARYRTMKPKWDKQKLQQIKEEKKESSHEPMEEDDDMLITVNVGRILYNKHNPELSIPSTIKEEPSSTRHNIFSDFNENNKGRKRKNSHEKLDPLTEEQPSKKRIKLGIIHQQHNDRQMSVNNGRDEHTFDVFAELTTNTNYTNTIHSHYETPLKKLDFATPNIRGMSMDKRSEMISEDQTQEIESMTQFFKQPIKISDRRMNDTPTVHGLTKKFINPTQTVTFHSKAAINDINKLFGAEEVVENNNVNNMQQHECNNMENDGGFGIYTDTVTIHEQIDIKREESRYEDTQTIHGNININNIQLEEDMSIPKVETLCIENSNNNNVSELPLLAVDSENENDNDAHMNEGNGSVKQLGVLVMDPLDENVMNKYELMIGNMYLKGNDSNIFDERGIEAPISVNSLLSGETDIELDDENDVYLNVTEYIKSLSVNGKYYIFFVNDLSQDDDTERMLVINCVLSLRNYYISKCLKDGNNINVMNMEYGFVESVYLYNGLSFSLCKVGDNVKTLNDILLKANEINSDLNEKLILYYITEIMRIIYQLHENDIIHLHLKLNSFLVKLAECNEIKSDWNDNSNNGNRNGWENFGLLLHDINNCIKINDFIDFNDENINKNNFGCLINEKNLKNNNILKIFQNIIKNKPWCYEIDYFLIFVICVQLLTQNIDENIISEILNNNNNIMDEIDKYRDEKGLEKVQNRDMWNKILNMLLMKDINNNNNNNLYEFDNLSIVNRRNYLKECYKHCAIELMDLEQLSPKLQIILARLDRMIQT